MKFDITLHATWLLAMIAQTQAAKMGNFWYHTEVADNNMRMACNLDKGPKYFVRAYGGVILEAELNKLVANMTQLFGQPEQWENRKQSLCAPHLPKESMVNPKISSPGNLCLSWSHWPDDEVEPRVFETIKTKGFDCGLEESSSQVIAYSGQRSPLAFCVSYREKGCKPAKDSAFDHS